MAIPHPAKLASILEPDPGWERSTSRTYLPSQQRHNGPTSGCHAGSRALMARVSSNATPTLLRHKQ